MRSPAILYWYWSVLAASLLIGAAVDCYFAAWPQPTASHLSLRLAAGVALLISGVVLARAGLSWVHVRAAKSWWDPAPRPDGDLNWQMVLELTCGTDPLDVVPDKRLGLILHLAAVAVGGLVAGAMSLAALRFLLNPHVPAMFVFVGEGPAPANAALNLSGNLTALLALIAASISIIFTYHQLRAKVRADNRQAWIARLRTLLAEVVGLSHQLDGATAAQTKNVWKDLGAKRPELELMLNPREKDHRLLMYLIQRMSDDDLSAYEHIADARHLRKTLTGADNQFAQEWRNVLDCTDRAQLTDYVMRLSHVVLKREWERVKRTR